MDAIEVENCRPITHKAMRVTLDYMSDIVALIQAGSDAGKFKGSPDPVKLSDGTTGWQIQFLYPDNRTPLMAHPGYWIIEDSNLNVEVLTPPEACARFRGTTPLPFESGDLTVPPEISVMAGNVIQVKVRQPRALNGPWTYSVSRTNMASGAIAHLIPAGEIHTAPVSDADGGRVIGADDTFTLPDSVAPGNYIFAVTATSARSGAAVTTPESATITLTGG